MRGGPSFFDVEHRLKQLSGLGDYPEEYRQRSVTRYFGPISCGGAMPRARKGAMDDLSNVRAEILNQYDRMSFIVFPL